jgi:hypothetical protein
VYCCVACRIPRPTYNYCAFLYCCTVYCCTAVLPAGLLSLARADHLLLRGQQHPALCAVCSRGRLLA